MKLFELKLHLIAPLAVVCCLIGIGSRPAQAQSATNTLFVANTSCTSCLAVPPVGLTAGVATANPSSALFSGLPVTLNGTMYGNGPKFGGGNGGPTGWIHVTYSVPEGTPTGNYILQFEVSHAGDQSIPSALAIDNIASPNFNESFESEGIPAGWTLSGGASGFSGATGGVSPQVTNLAPTAGSLFGWITTGCNPDLCNNTLGSVATSYGSLYQGVGTNGLPTGQGLGSPTVGTTLQSPTFLLNAGDTISFDVNYLTADGTYDFPDFATVQLILTTLPGSTITPTTGLAQQFTFNNTPGQQVIFNFDYSTASTASTLTVVGNTVPKVTQAGISPSDYQTMVKGTALAETNCLVDPGQLDSGGFASCPEFTIQCTNDSSMVLAGDNCPQSTARNMFFLHTISTTAPTVPAGSAPTMAMGMDNWSPTSGCTFVGPELGQLCPKSAATQFKDCCGGPGGTVKHSNSAFIGGCCEREWTTTPTISVWNKSTTVPVSFTAAPPPIINPPNTVAINNFTPAPGQSITFGFETPGHAPDPTFPIAGDQTLINPNPPSGHSEAPCGDSTFPLNWAPGTLPPSFSTNGGSVVVPHEGAWELHYFSTDCDDQEELVYNPLNGANNWAIFKTTPFNVDTTAPTVTGLTLSTTSPLPGGIVTATYNCSDPVSNGVASGLFSCGTFTGLGGVLSAGPLMSTFNVPAGANGPQTYSVTAKDVAGNSVTSTINYFAGYEFEGFFPPVANAPGVNKIDERTVVPLIFQVEKGSEVVVNGLKLGPSNGGTGQVSITATASNGAGCSKPLPAFIPKSLLNSGLLGLGGGFYVFPWLTNLQGGECVTLSLNLGDGVSHKAFFKAR